MTALDVLQKLKSKIDLDANFSNENVEVITRGSEKIAEGVVRMQVEGETKLIKVWAQDMGYLPSGKASA